MIVQVSHICFSARPRFCVISSVSLTKHNVMTSTCLHMVDASWSSLERLQYESHLVLQVVKSLPLSICRSSFGKLPWTYRSTVPKTWSSFGWMVENSVTLKGAYLVPLTGIMESLLGWGYEGLWCSCSESCLTLAILGPFWLAVPCMIITHHVIKYNLSYKLNSLLLEKILIFWS